MAVYNIQLIPWNIQSSGNSTNFLNWKSPTVYPLDRLLEHNRWRLDLSIYALPHIRWLWNKMMYPHQHCETYERYGALGDLSTCTGISLWFVMFAPTSNMTINVLEHTYILLNAHGNFPELVYIWYTLLVRTLRTPVQNTHIGT